MSTKPTKTKNSLKGNKSIPENGTPKKSSKLAKSEEDDDLDDELELDSPKLKSPKGKSASAKSKPDDDEEDDVDEADDVTDEWDKVEEEEEWDPDFEEFDLPKSKGKKSPGKKASATDEDEDFKIDDEFKDIFNDNDAGFDDEDDDF